MIESGDCISRNAAIEAMYKDAESNPNHTFWTSQFEALMDIPAADVRPVCHGRWVKARGSWCTPGGDPVWECSECGKGKHVYGIEHGTYDGQWVSCPNCGADMREANDEKA